MTHTIKLEELQEKIKSFYDPYTWHFVTLNATDEEDGCILQWIFSKYEDKDEFVVYETIVSYDQIIPSIQEIIPSAIMSEREVVDMFGLQIENTKEGLYLDETSTKHPLRGSNDN